MKKEDEQILQVYADYRGKLQKLRDDTREQITRLQLTYNMSRNLIIRNFDQDVNRLIQEGEIEWPL